MKQRSINLDLVRIIAAFMVLTLHIGQHVGVTFEAGPKGVQLFFLLSGYLTFASLEKTDSVVSYYKNRLIRILPTYYFCLILVYLEDIAIAIHDGTLHEVFAGQCGIKFLRYVFFLQCFLPSDNWDLWNNHNALWTMSSFVGFYIIAPFLFKWIKKTYAGIVVVLTLMLSRPWLISVIQNVFSNYPEESHIEWFAASNPLTELYCFMLGAVLYVAIKERRQYLYLAIMAVALLASSLTWYTYEIIFLLFVALSVLTESITSNEKIKSAISWVSRGSFTLYLVHPLILAVEAQLWSKFGIWRESLHALFLYACCILVSYALYYGVINKIEKRIK